MSIPEVLVDWGKSFIGSSVSFDRFARVTNSPEGPDFPLAHVNSSTRNLLRLDPRYFTRCPNCRRSWTPTRDTHALIGERVDVRSLMRPPTIGRQTLDTEIIGKDHDDVWRLALAFIRVRDCTGLKQRNAPTESQRFEHIHAHGQAFVIALKKN